MSYSLTTHKIHDFMTPFWHANCMSSLRGHRTPLLDMLVMKKKGGILGTKIYRKETHTKRYVGSVVEWLTHRTEHGLGSKPTCAILLCPWERHFTALSPAWWS